MAPPAEGASVKPAALSQSAPPAAPLRHVLARICRAGLLLLGLAGAGLVLRTYHAGPGPLHVPPTPRGVALFLAAGALLTAAGVPRQAVAFAGGYGLGAAAGFALSLLAQMLGCVADYVWARALARDWARRRLSGRMQRLHERATARPFVTTLTLRLLPIGNNVLLNLFAGAAALRVGPFLLATVLGYVPQTAVFALAGGGTQIGRNTQLGLAGILFTASAGLGVWLLRREGRGK